MPRAEKMNGMPGSLRLVTTIVAAAVYLHVAEAGKAPFDPSNSQERVVGQQGKTAEQVYKNIQVLNGLPASDLDGVMYFMSASLGVGCTHCHTNLWDSDAKNPKLAARRMILMTRAINKENFSGNPAITCYTCHGGQAGTVPNPPPDLPADTATTSTKPPSLPSTDEIIDRYVGAIGGEAAIEKLKTRVSRGTETTTNRMTPPLTLPIELYQTAENKLLIIRKTPGGDVSEGFNGSSGWIKDNRGQAEMSEKRLSEIRRDMDVFRYQRIRQSYPQMRVLGKERVGGREAYVVGATSSEDAREKLYFDAQTGLLIRKYVAYKTAFGSIPEVTDFDDYRAVGGVTLPFTVAWSRPPFSATRKFVDIKLNAIIDDSRFERGAR